jgi:DNA-binding LacI/PurR family transcriptional regulator
MNVTIKDIARSLSIAPSTVSMALNNNPKISKRTRKRVQDYARKLHYKPNVVARAMVKKRTQLIGLIVTDIMSSFFPQIIQGIEDVIAQDYYSAILCATNHEPRREREYLTLLQQKRVDGIIAEPVETAKNKDFWVRIFDGRIPFVAILQRPPVEDGVYVGVDNFLGGRLATRHLISLGHSIVGHLAGPQNFTISRDRKRGFRTTMREHNLRVYESLIVETAFNWQSGYEGMKRLLAAEPRLTAVFAAGDIIAIGASYAIRESGLRVPEDIAIVGFDDLPLASIAEVPLTTVAQPKYELGELAAKKLCAWLRGEKVESEVLAPSLVVRDSCGENLLSVSAGRAGSKRA